MARVIDEFPKNDGYGVFPWDEWANEKIWEISFGRDFHMPPAQMIRKIHAEAIKRNAFVKIQKPAPDYILFQFMY